jgi:hypothetical protein
MMPLCCRLKTLTLGLFIALTIGSCASKNYLVVNYQLPSETITAKETEISLIFKDQRAEETIVTQNAKKALRDFSGNFALIVASDSRDERLVGAFSLSSLMKNIFTQRLENAGMRVAPEDQRQATALEIVLKAFKLDLVKRNWVVQMTYQANLLKHNRFVSGETITGTAERLRVVGSKDAEKVIGELMTDAVNRLDLDALFRSAGI